ncbi:UDP-glucosyltransferase UGT13248-like [Miscanthus floridulus]|uniref:UDP-glucosyltransferase UGT13248-like n=1 Tax=Miscanthus floridulus TaxID=154761 RepID=UPI00345757C4
MAGTDSSSTHVLPSYPSQGHINPLLQLGKRLAAHRARFVLGQSGQPSPGAVHVATYSDGCDSGGYSEAGNEQEFLARLESAGLASLDELLRAESAQGRPVHAVVYDSFLLWVPGMARRQGASCAAFFTQACAVNVAYSHARAGRVELPVAAGARARRCPACRPLRIKRFFK